MMSPQAIRSKYTKTGFAKKFFVELIIPQVEICLKSGSATSLAGDVCAVFEAHWETNDDCFKYIGNDARVFHELCLLAEQELPEQYCTSSLEPIEVFDWAMKGLIKIYCDDINSYFYSLSLIAI